MRTTTTTAATAATADARTGLLQGWRPWLVLAGLALALGVANIGIAQRERVLRDGRVLLLELAPADPRSLMQGDYMRLRFAAAVHVQQAMDPECRRRVRDAERAGDSTGSECMMFDRQPSIADGYAVFAVGRDDIGRFRRLQPAPVPAAADEIAVRVRLRGWEGVRIASNAWFFAEGEAARWEPARYGELRVGADGTALLTGLRDGTRKPL